MSAPPSSVNGLFLNLSIRFSRWMLCTRNCSKIRVNGKIASIAVLVVCRVNDNGCRNIIAVEPMVEEFEAPYRTLFENLKGPIETCDFGCSCQSDCHPEARQ